MNDKVYTIKEQLANLIDLKTIVTLSLTGAFIYLAIIRAVTAEDFTKMFTVIIVFYFGTQNGKNQQLQKDIVELESEETIPKTK